LFQVVSLRGKHRIGVRFLLRFGLGPDRPLANKFMDIGMYVDSFLG
jgi:hypothetical protein